MKLSVRRACVTCSFAFLLAVVAARPAAADTLTLMWDRSSDTSVAGYLVYVGTQSGVYSTTFDVGNTTSFSYSNAAAGQPYYFAVAAYYPGPLVGARSAEVSGLTNAAPVLTNPGNQSNPVGGSVSLGLSGSDPAGQPVSYGVTALPPGLALTSATGLISGTPTTPGSYLVTAVVSDGVLSDSETFTWTITQALGDSAPPTVSITIPTTDGTHIADQTFVTIGGTASDDSGAVTRITWSSDRGGSGSATGTDTWIAGVPVQKGQNTITVSAYDEAGNVSSASIVIRLTGKFK